MKAPFIEEIVFESFLKERAIIIIFLWVWGGGEVNLGFAYFIGRKSEILCYQYRTFYISSSPCGQSRLSSSKIPLSSELCALVFDSCFVISSLEEARVNLMAL